MCLTNARYIGYLIVQKKCISTPTAKISKMGSCSRALCKKKNSSNKIFTKIDAKIKRIFYHKKGIHKSLITRFVSSKRHTSNADAKSERESLPFKKYSCFYTKNDIFLQKTFIRIDFGKTNH